MKETIEKKLCTTVLRRRKPLLYFFLRELVHYCSQEKETGDLLFWRELVQKKPRPYVDKTQQIRCPSTKNTS